jgi:hypothetical protein
MTLSIKFVVPRIILYYSLMGILQHMGYSSDNWEWWAIMLLALYADIL